MGVVKLADYQPQREVLESKVASLDDGYMRIATSIGKLKPKLKLAGREHQVLDAVIYCTFGWNKSEDKVTNTYLADVTGLDDSDVAAALNVLAERRIINLRKVGGFKLVSVNVSIDKWVLNKTPKKITQKVGRNYPKRWAKRGFELGEITRHPKQSYQRQYKYPPTPRGGVCRAGRKTCHKENSDRLPGGAVCIQHHPGRPPSPGRGTKRQTSPCYQTPADRTERANRRGCGELLRRVR